MPFDIKLDLNCLHASCGIPNSMETTYKPQDGREGCSFHVQALLNFISSIEHTLSGWILLKCAQNEIVFKAANYTVSMIL